MWETKDMLGDDMKQIRIAGDTQTFIATLQLCKYLLTYCQFIYFYIINSTK